MDKILFFDGVCVMCNSLVSFALRHDKKRKFCYATLQGDTAKKLLPAHLTEMTSAVLVDEKGIHTESDAILRLVIGFGGIWSALQMLMIIPKSLRDAVYRVIAKNRYRWFGTTDSCALLSKEDRRQILE